MTDILVTVMDADSAPYAAKVAAFLREKGFCCELFPAAAKLKKQLRHAERTGKRWVIFAGADEAATATVGVKDLALERGEQTTVALKALPEVLGG